MYMYILGGTIHISNPILSGALWEGYESTQRVSCFHDADLTWSTDL